MSNITNHIKNGLNQQQFDSAMYTDTSSLILAGAGSGKTRVLTYKIANLIFNKGVRPSNILAVTFTNKAANEMKERLMKIAEEMSEIKNKENNTKDEFDFDALVNNSSKDKHSTFHLSTSDLKWVGTFHSIFLKILKEDIEGLDMGYTKSFGIYDESDAQSTLKEVLKELNLNDKLEANEIKRVISGLKNQAITYHKYQHQIASQNDEYLGKVYEKYQKKLQQSNMLDFDDLLLLPHVLFQSKPDILQKWQTKFEYILVDEAQDTNQLQFELVKMLSGKTGNITFIGDDFQSIYGWRGAVMDNFLNLQKWWPDIKTFHLSVNYRSRPHIIQAGNHIIAKNTKQYKKNIESHRTGEDKIRLFAFSDGIDEAFNIVKLLIKKMKEEKNFKWGDFAILYRTNAQSQPFEQVLITEGIPYKIYGGFKFFERKEIKDVVSYLKYLINPRDGIALKRIINTPNRKIGATTIEKLDEYSQQNAMNLNEIVENIERLPIKLGAAAVGSIKQFSTIMKVVMSQLNTLTLSQLIESMVNSIKYKDYLIGLDGKEKAEERMENIGQLINMASKYEIKGVEGLMQFMEEITLMTDLEENKEGELDAVKLMTVHASKGLEFPIVFIVGLEENIFPLSKAKFNENELEEERRLMYVAITRAKDILFMSYANSRQQWGQTNYNAPSRFLDEIPFDLIKSYDLSGETKKQNQNAEIETGMKVRHKLFGAGVALEVWNEVAVVKFFNAKYGTRKIDIRFLEKI